MPKIISCYVDSDGRAHYLCDCGYKHSHGGPGRRVSHCGRRLGHREQSDITSHAYIPYTNPDTGDIKTVPNLDGVIFQFARHTDLIGRYADGLQEMAEVMELPEGLMEKFNALQKAAEEFNSHAWWELEGALKGKVQS